MTLSAGAKIGRYEIVSALGAGGMGEVYRARDSRLGRDVAIKILPESFASDAERLRRFEQEARSVAALNHPNIMSVYDVGLQGETPYIVTELLEGETLRERLRGGALPSRRASEYGTQIAHGLAAAHEKGFVHRDLKPENLFVTKDGRVKILDFGLAKQAVATLPTGDELATLGTTANTSAGMAVGTAGYMAPEQVKGEAVDHRCDIFAFGTVLFETLSGRRPFQRNSSVETMAAILKDDPPELDTTGTGQIPAGMERIVRRCLEKSPNQRFQSAKDLGFALENISAGASQQQAVLTDSPRQNLWRNLSLVLAVVALTGLALALRGFMVRPHQPIYRQVTFRRGYILSAHFTHDGGNIISSAAWERPPSKIYTSRLDGTGMRALDVPPGDILAVSRSDELAIALGTVGMKYGRTSGSLVRVPLSGGAPRELLDHVLSADWSPDGSQLAVARFEAGKCRLEYPIHTVLYETAGWISHIRISPNGDAIAFMDHPIVGDDRGTVAVVGLHSDKQTLTKEWSAEQGLAWSPEGREIWFTAASDTNDRALYAVSRAGKQRLVLQSPGSLLLKDIGSDSRILIAREDVRSEVFAGQLTGATTQLSWLQYMWAQSPLSRDGQFAAINNNGASGDYDVYLARIDGSPAVLLGSGIASGISPDNKWVAAILPSDTTKVLLLPTGMGETKTVTSPNFHYDRADFTSDGKRLVISAGESGHSIRSWVQNISGGEPRAITPEGISGNFITVNHFDYVSARGSTGTLRLYPVDGGEAKPILGLTDADQILSGSPEADIVYVTPDDFGNIPVRVFQVNITTGERRSFVTVEPNDPAGVFAIEKPLVDADRKAYVYTQYRGPSILYLVDGLK